MGEVFDWLGTPDQRARRSLLGKLGRFHYFDEQLDYPDWRFKRVLDFGGNEGNLLMDPGCSIAPERYYCVDVLKDALEEGRKRFPTAHWIHYNCYNRSFNPDGIEGLPLPDMGVRFDIIVAFSVFTHTTREEMHSLVRQLRERLAPGGTLAFTFIDPFYRSDPQYYSGNNLRWRLHQASKFNPAVSVDKLMETSRGADWCSVSDGSRLFVNSSGIWDRPEDKTAADRQPADPPPADCKNYDVFYTVRFLRRDFPGVLIRPPLAGHTQHCCLMPPLDTGDAGSTIL